MRNRLDGSVFRAVILALLAVGVPITVAGQLVSQITQHPWQALGLALLYEFLLLFGSFVRAAWQGVRARWVERATDWLDVHLRWLFAGYRRQYCAYLLHQYRDVDLRGHSAHGPYALDLDQVFVDLRLAVQMPQQVATDLLTEPGTNSEQYPLWHYLTISSVNYLMLVILGPPGSGKTMLAKYLTLALATRQRHLQGYRLPALLPVLLFLRDHATRIQGIPDYTLTQAIYESIPKSIQPISARWFEEQLRRGRCLVIFDGLDEVADPTVRQEVASWVEQQRIAYGENRFLLTSRPLGYRTNPLNGVVVLEVCSFTEEQVERFVRLWYLADALRSRLPGDPIAEIQAEHAAKDIVRKLQGSYQLLGLTVNPLLLTMIATVYRYRSSLPERRVELYAEICEIFLGRRQQAKGLPLDLAPAQKQQVLQLFAYHLMVMQRREAPIAEAKDIVAPALARMGAIISPENFLNQIQAESGLLVEHEAGVYSFTHPTFQEYLAAVHIKENDLEQKLLDQLSSSWWQETIQLYCAQADATNIVLGCLDGNPPDFQRLVLAAICRREASGLAPDARRKFQEQIEQDIEAWDPERQNFACKTLLDDRLWRLEHSKPEQIFDLSLLTRAEYQVFLDDKRAQKAYFQPDHWKANHYVPGQGHIPVSGVRPSDAIMFCQWLTSRGSGEWLYRLPRVQEVPSQALVVAFQSAQMSYWANADGEYICAEAPIIARQLLKQRLLDDLRRAPIHTPRAPHQHNRRILSHSPSKGLIRARTFASILGLDLDLVLSRTRTSSLKRMLEFDLEIDHIHYDTLDHARLLGLDLSHALVLALEEITPSHPLNLDKALGNTFERAFDSILALDSSLALSLAHGIELARAHARARTLGAQQRSPIPIDAISELHSDSGEMASFLRWYIRYCTLTSAFELLSGWWKQPVPQAWTGRSIRLENSEFRQALNACLELYLDFVLLEERIQGTLDAFEGILIIKEARAR